MLVYELVVDATDDDEADLLWVYTFLDIFHRIGDALLEQLRNVLFQSAILGMAVGDYSDWDAISPLSTNRLSIPRSPDGI